MEGAFLRSSIQLIMCICFALLRSTFFAVPGLPVTTTANTAVAVKRPHPSTQLLRRYSLLSSGARVFVLILEKEKFRGRLGGPSQRDYSGIELAVNLAFPPMEVEKLATKILPIDVSLAILQGMGFPIVEKLFDTKQLEDAPGDEKRLFPKQIEEYSRRALEVQP